MNSPTQVPPEEKSRPILFSAPMVLSILEGRKTHTRRVVHLPRWAEPCNEDHEFELDGNPPWPHAIARKTGCLSAIECPYGDAGDFLWVREAHAIVGNIDPGWVLYRASGYQSECRRHKFDNPPPESAIRWRPSIHMPRWASRIDLQVTMVRVERLQDISEADILAEGVTVDRVSKWCNVPWSSMPTLHHAWRVLWEHINGFGSWDLNPWVWATAFKRIETARAAA